MLQVIDCENYTIVTKFRVLADPNDEYCTAITNHANEVYISGTKEQQLEFLRATIAHVEAN